MAVNQPGTYVLSKCILWSYDLEKSVDISHLMYKMSIGESMSVGSVRGSAVIVESLGLIDGFPIKGQELLELEYTDFFGYKRQELYAIYAISDLSYADAKNPGFVSYTLNFVSILKFYSENEIIQQAFNGGVISEYAKNLYITLQDSIPQHIKAAFPYAIKTLTAENTTNPRSLVIPKMNGEGSMHFLSRNAYSDTNPIESGEPSQTFRFFEARDGFFFATFEYMRSLTVSTSTSTSVLVPRPILSFNRNYSAAMTPNSSADHMQAIIDVNFGAVTNTIDYIASGGYSRVVHEFDINTMNINSYDYNYYDRNNDKLNVMHDSDFVRQHMSKSLELHIFKDWDSSNDPHYRELYTVKPVHLFNHQQYRIQVTVYGRNDLFAGSTVNLTFLKHMNALDGAPTIDEVRSGLYYVEGIISKFDGNIFTQSLDLTRGRIN